VLHALNGRVQLLLVHVQKYISFKTKIMRTFKWDTLREADEKRQTFMLRAIEDFSVY